MIDNQYVKGFVVGLIFGSLMVMISALGACSHLTPTVEKEKSPASWFTIIKEDTSLFRGETRIFRLNTTGGCFLERAGNSGIVVLSIAAKECES